MCIIGNYECVQDSVPIKVEPPSISAVVASDNSIRVQHRHHFKYIPAIDMLMRLYRIHRFSWPLCPSLNIYNIPTQKSLHLQVTITNLRRSSMARTSSARSINSKKPLHTWLLGVSPGCTLLLRKYVLFCGAKTKAVTSSVMGYSPS
jgi:hypothetical protein